MKKIILVCGFLLPLAAIGQQSGPDRLRDAGIEGAIVGGVLGLIGSVVAFLVWLFRRLFRKAKPKVERVVKGTSSKIQEIAKSPEQKILDVDESFFERAFDEIERGEQRDGLWAKSLALAEGDEQKQQAIYLKLRASQIELDERNAYKDDLLKQIRKEEEARQLKLAEARQLKLAEEALENRTKETGLGCSTVGFLGFALALLIMIWVWLMDSGYNV